MATSYPDSQHSDPLQVGAEFLDFVTVTLHARGLYLQPFTSKKYQYNKGESLQGWEVKLDQRLSDTHRLSIEIAEKTRSANAIWVPSGIYRNDNTWLYIQGNYDAFYIFLKRFLIQLHQCKRYTEHEIPTVRKFYLPVADADRYGERIARPIAQQDYLATGLMRLVGAREMAT